MIYRNPQGAVIESFTYAYDSRGNRTTKVFADGGAEQYGYDELSRLVRATYPSGREVHYEYDAVGNRLAMVEGSTNGPAATCTNDSDCDGILDTADNCPNIANAVQQDTDNGSGLSVPGASAVWSFEEASGTTALESVGGKNGTLLGGVTRVSAGRFGRAASFDGVNDSVLSGLNVDQNGASSPALTVGG